MSSLWWFHQWNYPVDLSCRAELWSLLREMQPLEKLEWYVNNLIFNGWRSPLQISYSFLCWFYRIGFCLICLICRCLIFLNIQWKPGEYLIEILFELTELRLPVELEISMIKEYLSVRLLPYNGFYNLPFSSSRTEAEKVRKRSCKVPFLWYHWDKLYGILLLWARGESPICLTGGNLQTTIWF